MSVNYEKGVFKHLQDLMLEVEKLKGDVQKEREEIKQLKILLEIKSKKIKELESENRIYKN
jgi:predicted DNA-binding antitoxin AbrB/MazE fold protein